MRYTILALFSLLISSTILAAQPIPHDPTQPIDAAQFSQEDGGNAYGLKIDTIIIGKNNKYVIINGQRLQIDDKINELIVLDISPDSVKLKNTDNEKITIKIPYSEIKQQVSIPGPGKK